MTDDEARQALGGDDGNDGWIDWNTVTDKPDWFNGKIILDGNFSVAELLAILHFAPKE